MSDNTDDTESGMTRREAMKSGGAVTATSLLGESSLVGAAAAQEDQEPRLQLGENYVIDDRGDDIVIEHLPSGAQFTYDSEAGEWTIGSLQATSVAAGEVNATINATHLIESGQATDLADAVRQALADLAPDGGKITIEAKDSMYSWPTQVSISSDTTATQQTAFVIEGDAPGGNPDSTGPAMGVTIDISSLTSGPAFAADIGRNLRMESVTWYGGGATNGSTACEVITPHSSSFENVNWYKCTTAVRAYNVFALNFDDCLFNQNETHFEQGSGFLNVTTFENTEFGAGSGSPTNDAHIRIPGNGNVRVLRFVGTDFQGGDYGAMRAVGFDQLAIRDCHSEENNSVGGSSSFYFDDASHLIIDGLDTTAESATDVSISAGNSVNEVSLYNVNLLSSGTVLDIGQVPTLNIFGGRASGDVTIADQSHHATILGFAARGGFDGPRNSMIKLRREGLSRNKYEPRSNPPSTPQNGDVAYADGDNWNPGSGEGIYAYESGGWTKL